MNLDQYLIGSSMDEIATEGFLADFIDNVFSVGTIDEKTKREAVDSFYSMLTDPKELFGKAPETAQYKLAFKPVIINEKKGFISIQNIDIPLLLQRVKDTYGEKKLDAIFYKTYSSSHIKLYNKKRLNRGQMKITSLLSPIFFALELSILFSQLYRKYHTNVYKTIVTIIYKETWVGKSDKIVASKPDLQYAQTMLNPKYALKAHQVDFINAYPTWKAKLNLRGVYLAFDQGLGKTLTAMSLAMALHTEKIYIICPNTLVANWYNEIMNYYNGRVIPFDCKSGKAPKNAQVFITNNESIKNILPYLDASCKSMMIVDEGHNFRNINSSRVQELIQVQETLKPNDVLPMSGTPLKATPNELVPAFKLLDPTFTEAAATMYNRCFNFDNYAAMEIVTARLGKMIYRKMKSDVLTLPDKHLEDLRLKIPNPDKYLMTNVRLAVIEAIRAIAPKVLQQNYEILTDFKDVVERYSTAGKFKTDWYLNKIFSASDPNKAFSIEEMHELDTERVFDFLDKYIFSNPDFPHSDEALIRKYEAKLIHYDRVIKGRAVGQVYPPLRTELYNSLWDNNEELFLDKINGCIKKTVIFSQFFGVVSHIKERLEKNGIGVVTINGSVNNAGRVAALQKFQNDPDTRVIIATSQSMGTGVTLIEASQMFFFGPPWRSADYDQCCDRIYRIGQDTDVYIYNVILDTPQLNLSSRMDAILKWSSDMFHAAIDETIVANEGYIDHLDLDQYLII